MEMPIDIDSSIKELSKWRKDLSYDNGDYYYGGDTTEYSLDVAISTMKKYQKIQEIVNGWNRYRNGVSSSEGDSIYMQKISEVVEDGKIDRR